LWHVDEDGHRLDNKVRDMLLKVSTDFVTNLKKDNEIEIKIHDVVIIGSSANYNWTDYSDVDLHIITDYSDLEMTSDDAQTLFDAIKVNWNNKHDIKMKGHDVEIYVQDKTHKPVSTAEYSVLNNKWNKEPKKEDPKFDKELIKKKYKEYKGKINSLVKEHNETALKKLLEKLYKFRQAGLDSGGELSEENIVFKILRAHGLLDKVKDNIVKIYDKKMSVKEIGFHKSEYAAAIDNAVDEIYRYTAKFNKYPDINPILEKLVSRFNVDIEQVYSDVAKGFHEITQ
jgi:hypothetical protein